MYMRMRIDFQYSIEKVNTFSRDVFSEKFYGKRLFHDGGREGIDGRWIGVSGT